MKLRIRANTLRLRLTRAEVDAIGRGETVTETTAFPEGSVLGCSLIPAGPAVTAGLHASDSGAVIEVHVPAAAGSAWALGDGVSLGGEGPMAAGPLQILIEKDFACLAPRPGEEEIDTFPNPGAAT